MVALEVGQKVRSLRKLINGLVEIPELSYGVVLSATSYNRVTIWFPQSYHGKDAVVQALKLDNSYNLPQFSGFVFQLKRSDFAISCSHGIDTSAVKVADYLVGDIPFVNLDDLKKSPTNLSLNVNGIMTAIYDYSLDCIIDDINENFDKWVRENTESVKVTKKEKENGDYPYDWDRRLTDKSLLKYKTKQLHLELNFARITGYYYHFLGGIIEP